MADTTEDEPTGSAPAADDDDEDLFADEDEADDQVPAPIPAQEAAETAAKDATEAAIPVEADANTTKEGLAAETSDQSAVPPTAGTEVPIQKEDEVPPPSADAPIPRVSASSAPTTSSLTPIVVPPAKRGNGAKFGLPEDIVVPATVTSSLLNGRLLETLRGLPKQLINDALAEYDDAVQIKGDSIRNHGAYLFGVVKRYVSVQERASSGEGVGILPMGPELTPAVNERLQKLVQDQFCSQEEMNDKVKSKIRMLSQKDALFAIEELASVDRTQIRNFGSYFMGILNRYMRGERKDLTSGKKTLAEVRQGFQQQQKHQSPPQRFDDRRRDDRYQRGRDSEPQFRRGHDPNDAYRRERSRDRYGDKGFRNEQHDFNDQYDPRNQRPPYPGQPPMGGMPSNPPPPPPRPSGMGGGVNPYQPQPQPYGQNPSPYGQQMPPMNQQQPPQQYGPPGSSYGNPQQQVPPRGPMVGGPPPPSQQYGQQNIVQQPQYGNMQQTGPPGAPPMQGNPPPNSYGVPPNQQNSPYMGAQPQPPQQQSYSNPPYSQPPPGPYSQPPGGQGQWGNQGGVQNPPPSQTSAMDILALADKASSAVQALQNQNKFQMQPLAANPQMQQAPPNPYQPGAPPNPYGSPPSNFPPNAYPPMNQPHHQQHAPPNQAYAGGGGGKPRRRTTATMGELPVTVQYAVQNLQATGQINGPLDDGMLGMVKDLPENLALQALQKFSSIDKNTMRNKTAYLAGVLRRELEKINRR